jgi:FkbM family methyltransferase
VISEYARPGTTIIDCGAWIGPTALWASSQGAHVLAIEPDPLARRHLNVNVRLNKADVDIFGGAISNTTGMCHIQAHEAGWGSSMTRVMSEGTEVPCLTMPDLFDIFEIEHCSLVKIDVEGHEAEILEYAAPFLASLEIPLLVALHEPWWSRPVEPCWFADYSHISGDFCGWGQLLALP